MLLYPEGMVKLNGSAGEILKRCDGARDAGGDRRRPRSGVRANGLDGDVLAFVAHAREQRGWHGVRTGRHPSRTEHRARPAAVAAGGADLRCPLHCVFCYNPVDYARHGQELTTEDWLRVLREARALGAVQLGFSGGEPLVRDDLEVTGRRGAPARLLHQPASPRASASPSARIAALKEAGLDHIQLSFQDSTREMNDFLSQHHAPSS